MFKLNALYNTRKILIILLAFTLVFIVGCQDTKQENSIIENAQKIHTFLWDDFSKNKFKNTLFKLEENGYSEETYEQLALLSLTHGEQDFAKTLLEVLSKNSLAPDYDYYLTEIAIKEENYKLAHQLIINGLSKAQESDKKSFYLLRTEMLISLGEFNKALETNKIILKMNPNNIHAQYLQAKLQLLKGNCEKAIISYKNLIESLPQYTQFYSPLASAYRMCGEIEKANKYTKEHTDELLLFPNRFILKKESIGNPVSSLKNDIKAMIARGKFNNAIQLLLKLIEIDSTDDKAYINLGSMYFKIKKYDAAEKAYLKAYKLAPHNIKAAMNLGVLKTVMQDYDNAELYFQKAYELDPSQLKVVLNLTSIKMHLNKPSAAENIFIEFLKQNNANASVRKGLIVSMSMQNKYQLALDKIIEWYNIEPNSLALKKLRSQILLLDFNFKLSVVDDVQDQILAQKHDFPVMIKYYVLLDMKYKKSLEIDAAVQLMEELRGEKINTEAHQKFSTVFNQLKSNGYLGLEIFNE